MKRSESIPFLSNKIILSMVRSSFRTNKQTVPLNWSLNPKASKSSTSLVAKRKSSSLKNSLIKSTSLLPSILKPKTSLNTIRNKHYRLTKLSNHCKATKSHQSSVASSTTSFLPLMAHSFHLEKTTLVHLVWVEKSSCHLHLQLQNSPIKKSSLSRVDFITLLP